MREYAKILPGFWSSDTGKALRRAGPDALVVGLYLMTNQNANMLGVYRLPIGYIQADTGIPIEGASKALRMCCEAGLCSYDEASEVVWVYEMAKYQVSEQLTPKDKQVAGVRKAYANLPKCPFLSAFYEKYKDSLLLDAPRPDSKPHTSPFQGGSKPGAGAGAGTRDSVPDGTGGTPPAPEMGDDDPPVLPKVDPVDEIFALGLPLLMQAGIKEQSARSFLGLMRKQTPDDAKVVDAIRKCVEAKPLQPIEFLQGLLGKKPGNAKLNVKHHGGAVVEHA